MFAMRTPAQEGGLEFASRPRPFLAPVAAAGAACRGCRAVPGRPSTLEPGIAWDPAKPVELVVERLLWRK